MAIYLGQNCITQNHLIGVKHINIMDDKTIVTRQLSIYENLTTTQIASCAFAYCTNLSSVNLPNVRYINESAFYYCSNLTSINIPQAKTIEAYAFSYCSNLIEINLPEVRYIGNYAFRNCYNLISLNLSGISSIPTLSSTSVFYSTPIGGYSTSAGQYGSVYVPASLYTDFLTATNWSLISSRIVSI